LTPFVGLVFDVHAVFIFSNEPDPTQFSPALWSVYLTVRILITPWKNRHLWDTLFAKTNFTRELILWL